MKEKQYAIQSGIGTKCTGLTPKNTSSNDLQGMSNGVSGSSQSDMRGLREHSRPASAGSNQ